MMNLNPKNISKLCFSILAVLLLTVEFCSAQETKQATLNSTHFIFEGLPADSRMSESLVKMVEDCYDILESSLPGKMPGKIKLIWKDNSADFGDQIHDHSHSILAVAGRRTIICNGPAIQQRSLRESRKTLIHELVHVYLAEHAPVRIPRWLNEGLAMHVAREAEWKPTFSTSFKNVVGKLPTLDDLAKTFPKDQAGRSEAYLCSYLAVQYMRQNAGLFTILENLENPKFANSFYEQAVWEKIDQGYRNKFLTSFDLINIIFSGEIFWILIVGLFIVAYMVKRRNSKIKLEQMVEEEEIGYDDF